MPQTVARPVHVKDRGAHALVADGLHQKVRSSDLRRSRIGQRHVALKRVGIADVVWHEPELFDEICNLPYSCIILVLHNGFVHGTRALSYSKKKLAAVIGDPETILDDYKDNKVNHPEEIEIIPANSETLLRLTEVAKANKAIICAPDVFNPKTERCDLLSSAMFRFVGYTHLPLYCFDFYMDDDCVLRGFIKGPLEFERGPAKAAEDFIRFCKSVSGRDLTLMN